MRITKQDIINSLKDKDINLTKNDIDNLEMCLKSDLSVDIQAELDKYKNKILKTLNEIK